MMAERKSPVLPISEGMPEGRVMVPMTSASAASAVLMKRLERVFYILFIKT